MISFSLALLIANGLLYFVCAILHRISSFFCNGSFCEYEILSVFKWASEIRSPTLFLLILHRFSSHKKTFVCMRYFGVQFNDL